MDKHDTFEFAERDETLDLDAGPGWIILSVDDDPAYQASLAYSLQGLRLHDKKVTLLTAGSAAEAATILRQTPDIAVVLLDVVMEDDTAGLRLVGTIREVLGNMAIRIVLLTGQPGIAPRTMVMDKLDIDEYWDKADLTSARLSSVLTSQIRTWTYIKQINMARQNLQMIVDASRLINSKQNLASFASTVLSEVGKFIGIRDGGIICALNPVAEQSLHVVAASGIYQHLRCDSLLATFPPDMPTAAIEQSIIHHEHQLLTDYSIFYFSCVETNADTYLMVVKHDTDVPEGFQFMLQVFSENVSSGFKNIALLNRLSELAYQDPVLGIPNRNWLVRELELMTPAKINQTMLLKVEVEHLDESILTFGVQFCNRLLEQAYLSLYGQLPDVIAGARTGDNAFVFLLPWQADFDRQIIKQQHIMVDGFTQQLFLVASLLELRHFTFHPPETMLTLARAACSAARTRGKPFILVDSKLTDQITNGYNLLQDLRRAIRGHQLSIVLQPKVRLKDEAVVGLEALVRWRHPNGRFVPPGEFIPIAEASGIVGAIDRQVFEQVVDTLRVFHEQGITLPIAFNLSSSDLTDNSLMEDLIEFARSNHAGARLLEVEITETQSMDDYHRFRQALDRLIDAGIQVSIDDFGTGYSSLAQITHLKAHSLKIDKSFIDDVTTNINARHVTEMILRLGQRFGFSIIAEGIEQPEQKDYLLAQGCDIGQGYLFARPMPLEEVLDWLGKRTMVNDRA
ncbi:MAG: EAL domain-containing protein [Gammaproteobacteria bacterium]|nr:EAL domain-containing protein [Gammaproteobacteria bacterium]